MIEIRQHDLGVVFHISPIVLDIWLDGRTYQSQSAENKVVMRWFRSLRVCENVPTIIVRHLIEILTQGDSKNGTSKS